MKRIAYRRLVPIVTSPVQVKEKSPERVPDVESKEDPQEDFKKEGEPKKKQLKEALESDSNTLPLDYTTPNKEIEMDLDSTARCEAKPKEFENICESASIIVSTISVSAIPIPFIFIGIVHIVNHLRDDLRDDFLQLLQDPQEDFKKEGEPKKKQLKEALESDSNTLPLDYTTPNKEIEMDLDSTARCEAKPKEFENICESSVRSKPNSAQTVLAYILPDYPFHHSFF
nr:hypothetical protein [Tanacetum cinerariifolium]